MKDDIGLAGAEGQGKQHLQTVPEYGFWGLPLWATPSDGRMGTPCLHTPYY